jgi:hypothetical protein
MTITKSHPVPNKMNQTSNFLDQQCHILLLISINVKTKYTSGKPNNPGKLMQNV